MLLVYVLAGIFVIVLVLAFVFAKQSRARLATMTPQERAEYERELDALEEARVRATQERLDAAGQRARSARSMIRSSGAAGDRRAACPRCGDVASTARRSAKARVGAVANGLVGAAARADNEVTCVACGTRYRRG